MQLVREVVTHGEKLCALPLKRQRLEIQFFWRPLQQGFDQYDNFEQRGDDFIAAAKRIIQGTAVIWDGPL